MADVSMESGMTAGIVNTGSNKESTQMDKDRAIGVGKQIAGTVKETVGKIVGDAKLQVDGKAQRLQGKAQNAIGSAKDILAE